MSNSDINQESSVKIEHQATHGAIIPINKFSSQVNDPGSIAHFEGQTKSNRQIYQNGNAPQRRNLMRQGLNKPQPSQSQMQGHGIDNNDLTAKGKGTQSIPIITFTNMNPDLNKAGNSQARKFDNQQNGGGIIISQDTDKARNPMHQGNKKDASPYREFVLNKTQDVKSSIKLSNQMNSDMMLKKYSQKIQDRNLDQLKMRQNANQMDSNALQIQYQAMLMVNKSVLNTQQQQQQHINNQGKNDENAQDDQRAHLGTNPQPLILKQSLIQRQQTFSHNNAQQRQSKSPGLVHLNQNLMIDLKNDRKLQQIHNIYLNAGPGSHSQNISSHNSNNQLNHGASQNDYPHFQSQKIQNTSDGGKPQSQERSYLQLKRKVKPSTAGNPSSASKQYAQAQQHINGLPYPQAAAILSNTFLPYDNNNNKVRSKSPAKFINGSKIQQSHTPQTNMSMIRIDEYSQNQLLHQKAISSVTTLQQNSTSSLPRHYHNQFNPKSSSQQIAENLFGRKKYSLQPQSIGQINPFSQNNPSVSNDQNKNVQERIIAQGSLQNQPSSYIVNPASLYNPGQIRMHSNSTKIKISRNKQLLNKTAILPQSQLDNDSQGGQQLINKNLRGKFVDISPHSSKTQNVSMIVASAKKDLEDSQFANMRGEIKRGSYPKQESHLNFQNQNNNNLEDNQYDSKEQKQNSTPFNGIKVEMPTYHNYQQENDEGKQAQSQKRQTIFEQSSVPVRQKPSLDHVKLGNKEDARIKMIELLERQKADASQKISEYVQQTQLLRQDMRDSKGNAKNRYDYSSNDHSSEEIEHLEILEEAEDQNANQQAQVQKTNNHFDIPQTLIQALENQQNFRSHDIDIDKIKENLVITPTALTNHPTDDFSEIENPEKTESKQDRQYQTGQILAMGQNNQVSEFIIEHEFQEEKTNLSDAATRKNQIQNLIVEEMQPLYYFNVKPKLLESMSYEDSNRFNDFLQGNNTQSPYQNSMAQSFLNHKQNGLKEASTPFFIGSPVNNQANFLESMRRMSQDSQQENYLANFGGAQSNKGEAQMTLHVRISQPRQNVMTFENLQYESFGGSQRSLNDSPDQ